MPPSTRARQPRQMLIPPRCGVSAFAAADVAGVRPPSRASADPGRGRDEPRRTPTQVAQPRRLDVSGLAGVVDYDPAET